jgi:hypothetical protein
MLDSGRRANSEERVNTNKCPFLNGCRDRAVRISGPNSVRFLFVELDEEGFAKERWIEEINCSPARIKKCENQFRRTDAIFARELSGALKLTVGFSNIYRKL